MIISIQSKAGVYQINHHEPVDIAIPLEFNGVQPNAYGVQRATTKPCEAGDLIGDTRRGGSCNFEQMTFVPHCNGTHTECVGHLTHERISIHNCLKDAFITTLLITIEPENAFETSETYSVKLNENDKLITKSAIQKELRKSRVRSQESEVNGLIVRTLPNDANKLAQNYRDYIPPFFSTEAMLFVSELKFKHLLVDLPSIDRLFDEGKLSNHRVFWNVEPESFVINAASRVNQTITEMIFVPDAVADGVYLLNLQIPAFAADAAPSRPVLFKILA